jgi:hypothetical protein
MEIAPHLQQKKGHGKSNHRRGKTAVREKT